MAGSIQGITSSRTQSRDFGSRNSTDGSRTSRFRAAAADRSGRLLDDDTHVHFTLLGMVQNARDCHHNDVFAGCCSIRTWSRASAGCLGCWPRILLGKRSSRRVPDLRRLTPTRISCRTESFCRLRCKRLCLALIPRCSPLCHSCCI
jgi:hypothetical protein